MKRKINGGYLIGNFLNQSLHSVNGVEPVGDFDSTEWQSIHSHKIETRGIHIFIWLCMFFNCLLLLVRYPVN